MDLFEILNIAEKDHYETRLPPNTKKNKVFHESCLRDSLNSNIQPLTELPPIDSKGNLVWIPKEVLDTQKKKLKN